jgi:hypothetical protein
MNPTQDLVTREVTTLGVLHAAARYISVYGWWQGDMFADDGDLYPPACAMGAIRFAITGDELPFDDAALEDGRADRYMSVVDTLCLYLINSGVVCLTDEMIEKIERFDVVAEVVSEWNDDPARNVCQVLAALKAAAQEWDTTHTGGAS